MSIAPRAGRRRRVLPLVPANRLLRQEMVAFYLFASPWLIGLLVLTLGPMLAAVALSLTDYPVIVAPNPLSCPPEKLVRESTPVPPSNAALAPATTVPSILRIDPAALST